MIGSFRVAWHSVFAFIGMIAGTIVSIRCARYLVRDDRIYPFAIAVVIGGLVGARIAHVTDNPALYANDPLRALQFWNGGIGTMGAPIGSSVATLGQSTSVHLIGAYDGLLMLAIFVVLYLYWGRIRGHPPESRVWLVYLLLLGAGRFLLSFLRTDPLFLDGLQQAQVLGLLYLGAGAVTLPVLERRAAGLARAKRAQNGEKPLLKAVSDR